MSSHEHPTASDVLRHLLAERGVHRYALFLTQGEGKSLPGGIESLSGFVLTGQGEVYGFWLDWDDRLSRYVLAPWYRVEDPSEFRGDAAYVRARRELGLDTRENELRP